MIKLSAESLHCKTANRVLSLILALFLTLSGMFGMASYEVNAAASTVTLKYGAKITYGTAQSGRTVIKWVTHVDGEAVDLDEEAGITRSYAYCVQPPAGPPDQGTHKVTIVDDDDTGRISKMRKLIYYLPGSYGYTKVTKSRWFSGYTTNEAYVIGHLGLSWIYENYSNSDSVWGGAPSSMVKKTKNIVDDLKNLPDPPDDFEVFWVKVSGKQDVFGAFYSIEYGKANVKKGSANSVITENNSCYSLEGAEYTLYEDSACTVAAKKKDGSVAVMTTNASGESDTIVVETGTYYAKETRAPKGYAFDTKVYSIEVVKDKTTTLVAYDEPKSNETQLLIQKVDKETGLPIPQGAASLEGAEYTVVYYDFYPSADMSEEQMAAAVSEREPGKINGQDAIWVFKTDEQGRVDMSQPDRYLIHERSAELYRNSAGNPTIPIGIISVTETKEPEGYLLDDTVRYASIEESGTVENLTTLKTFTEERALKEQVIRGDISLSKAAEGRERMQGIAFSFTSLTNGEKHILVTDKNGYLCSASNWNSHNQATNLGKTARDGIWYNGYNDEETGAKPDDNLGALPYDKYLMEEIRSEANKGYELISDEITIERAGFTLDLGTYDDAKEPVPQLGTNARDGKSGTGKAGAEDEILIIDSVDYRGLKPGRKYLIEGILMDKKTGEPLLDDEGNEIRGFTEFYAEKEKGNVEVRFTFSGESLSGKSAVAFEYLKYEGEQIAEHADIKCKEQTVKIVDPGQVKGAYSSKGADTGDGGNFALLYYLLALGVSAEALLLTKKRRDDRLN